MPKSLVICRCLMTNAVSRSWVFNYLHITRMEWWEKVCWYNFLQLSRAMPKPVSAVNSKAGTLLSSAASHSVDTARRKGHPSPAGMHLLEANMATALSLHRTFTKANLQQHVPRGAPPHPNTPGQLHTPPRCITEPILLHYHRGSGPASAWSCPCSCMGLYFTNVQIQTCAWIIQRHL